MVTTAAPLRVAGYSPRQATRNGYSALIFSEYFPPHMGSDLRITQLAKNVNRMRVHFAVTPPMRILATGAEPSLQAYFDRNHGSGQVETTYAGMTGTYLRIDEKTKNLWQTGPRELAYASTIAPLVRQAKALIVRENPDIVVLAHASYLCGLVGMIAAQACGKKIVLDYPDAWTPLAIETGGSSKQVISNTILSKIEQHILRRADRVVSITRSLGEYVLGLDPSAKIEIVENGADHIHFNARNRRPMREKLGVPETARVILTSGRIEAWSGVDTMADTMAAVVRRLADAHFLVVGDGSRLSELKAAVAATGVGNRVTFTGLQAYADMPAIISSADLAYVPFPMTAATRPCTPVKLIEFTLMDVPVLTTPLPGITELFGSTLEYVSTLDPRTASNRLIETLEDLGGVRERAEFARCLSQQRYRWDRLGARFEDILIDSIESSSPENFLRVVPVLQRAA